MSGDYRKAPDHRPRKRFGQNFLHDRHVIARIVAAIAPKPGDHLVEIGPGLGALTLPLLQAAGDLDVVELDRDLIPRLEATARGIGNLRIYSADVLKFDFRTLAASGLRVVGNLPYNITSPLLFHLLEQRDIISDMHFMVQKEVALRLAAQPGTREYGRLTVMIQYACQVEHLFNVAPGAFNPPPKVDSSVISLRPMTTPVAHIVDLRAFKKLVAQAFTQRRKTLRNAVKGLIPRDRLEQSGFDLQRRPETLSVAEFAALANLATDHQ